MILSTLYNEFLYRPLLNALVFLIGLIPSGDMGVAIILLTLLVRLILFPLTHRSLVAQKKLKELEPEINKIKAETKNKKEDQARRIMELYQRHGVSPFSGCLILLVQLPVLIALYNLFWKGISLDPALLYSFIPPPVFFQTKFLGLLELSGQSWVLAILAGLSQFWQMKFALPTLPPGGKSLQEEFSRAMAIQSRYVFPLLIFFISLRFPAALALYWTTSNVLATLHEGWVRYLALAYGGRRRDQENN